MPGRASLPQQFGGALAPIAEAEVGSADDVDHVQIPQEAVVDELLPRHLHHGMAEVDEQHLVDAVEGLHQVFPVPPGRDQRRGASGDDHAGMAVKGHHGGGAAQLVGPQQGLPQQTAVAQVDAVEKAQGNDASIYRSPQKSS